MAGCATAEKRHRLATASAQAPYNRPMHIVAIAWLYVTLLMALTEGNLVAAVLSFLFYGLLPVALLLWVFSGSARRQRAQRRLPAADQEHGGSPPPTD